MAFSAAATTNWPPHTLPRIPSISKSVRLPQNSVSFRFSKSNLCRRRPLSIQSTAAAAAPTSEGLKPAISLTDTALNHLNKMRSERNEDLCLRIGVKQGGCSGMSYTMDFENRANARPDDSFIEFNGFVIVGCLVIGEDSFICILVHWFCCL
ncbi:iron-sulfur assembly protein IscA, chloroplastic-like isoform X2 [Tripterygium wilfordii]|uniref:iron-sulfur assembly protein IscA, chloroplastic-like isoform X2 n=1 Tax=Tripterygium wilfordii TaxID=458696 RepID=UPI0018F7E84B|nr:iron-sulfur assembly protein IscA, chloroplastic-like isoform X2 [Tripterygium wilfordii]